jgi:predicted MPP superfamily phosphohydrolase
MPKIRLAVASDLHYAAPATGQPSRPATAANGEAGDPMHALLRLIEHEKAAHDTSHALQADYLLCPGDITSRASKEGFDTGWSRLKDLRQALGAAELIATTGNHEVHSRADDEDHIPGVSTRAFDPWSVMQSHSDYPCTSFSDDDRWVYWGRGYRIAERDAILFVVINSSHFHDTTLANEYERGRISDIALDALQAELQVFVDKNKSRAFVALLHHHPIAHESSSAPEEKIQMHNGARLMSLLENTGVAWLVIHGHKHQGRLINAQGDQNPPFVLAAGSFGAFLDGLLATQTRLQFYIVEIESCDQGVLPTVRATIKAWSWSGTAWEVSSKQEHGLPDGCGFRRPAVALEAIAAQLLQTLGTSSYLEWPEAVAAHAELGQLMPGQTRYLRNALHAAGVKSTWESDAWFPEQVSR